jgi:hypothetical protein
MLKTRRKSGLSAEIAPIDTDGPTSRRNRLSKPPSLTHQLKSQNILGLQDADARQKSASTDSLADVQAVKIDSVGKLDNASTVSDLVSRFEAPIESQQSFLAAPKSRSSYRGSLNSMISESRPSLQSISSRDRLASLKNDSQRSLTRSPSSDELPESPRFSRRSSYAPGVATRKSSVAEAIKEEKEPQVQMEQDAYNSTDKTIDEDARSFDDGDDEDWDPPAAVPRAETPQSLDYTHLGSMGWGSLQVINGRASPAPSNLSKQLLNTARYASSEYGDADSGEQHHRGFLNGDSVYSTKNKYRAWSWQSKGSSTLKDEVPSMPSNPDPASFLASEYMADLPSSPYTERKATRGTFAERSEANGDASLESISRSLSFGSHRSYESAEVASLRSTSPVPSETGSVLRTTTKRTEMDDALFEDELYGQSGLHHRESPESWHSTVAPIDARMASTQGFESALEYSTLDNSQDDSESVMIVFRDGEQGTVTTSVHVESALLSPVQPSNSRVNEDRGFDAAIDSQVYPEDELSALPASSQSASPSPLGSSGKQDSGYSSNTSVRSVSGEKAASIDVDRRSIMEKVFKPILKSRKSTPDVPTFKNIRPTSISPHTSTTTIQKMIEAPTEKPKKTKKLTKRVPLLRQKQPIVLQTIESIDDLSIPPVPFEAKANLEIRAQEVPELETTYASMHHSRNRNSVSTVGLEEFQIDIRFPSPEPEAQRPKQQRRRSWFGKPKDEPAPSPKPSKRNSWRSASRTSQDAAGISQQHAMAIIDEWDMTAASLNSTPYDMIPGARKSGEQRRSYEQTASEPQSGRRLTKLQQRRTMDDKTAADYARRKSASIRERDAWNARQASMSKRSSSGKSSRAPSLTLNLPPIPIEPQAPWEHRESPLEISAPYESPESQAPWQHRESPIEIPEPRDLPPSPPTADFVPAPDMPPPPPPHSPLPFDVRPHGDEYEEPAPLPPRHSPRPRSVERTSYFEEPEDMYEAPAPPPPSHSPRPMDIVEDPYVVEDPWASQAAAWKLRREHAAYSHEGPTHVETQQEEDDLYPTIPLRREMHPQSAGPTFQGYNYPLPARPSKCHTFDIYQPNSQPAHYSTEASRGRSSFDAHQHANSTTQYAPEQSRGRTSFDGHNQQSRFYNHSASPAISRSHSPRPPAHGHPTHSTTTSRSHSPRPPLHHSNANSCTHSRQPSPGPSHHSSRHGSRGPSPAPAFGRFSGGLGYQYDAEKQGLGGSAGTRENAVSSENARGDYKGVQLRREWGVDLGDVPVSVMVGSFDGQTKRGEKGAFDRRWERDEKGALLRG